MSSREIPECAYALHAMSEGQVYWNELKDHGDVASYTDDSVTFSDGSTIKIDGTIYSSDGELLDSVKLVEILNVEFGE